MENKTESNYLVPILSALAGTGALLASISPLFFQNGIIKKLFIDQDLVDYAVPATIIGSFVALWQSCSIHSYSLFKDTPNWEQIKLRFLLMFGLFSVLFYSFNSLAINGILQKDFASIFQFIFYFSSFFCLLFGIGLMLRDSIADFRKKEIDSSYFDRIKSTLIKSGKVKLDLTIESVQNHILVQGEPFDWIVSKNISFKNDGKTYFSVMSNDYSQVLFIKEVTKTQQKTS
jgi:hypothetical protein